jgi:hypothetical protein
MKKSEQQILKELFSYIFNDDTPYDKLRKIDGDRSAHITKKLEINFPGKLKSASKTFANNLANITLVQRFISDQLKIDDQPFINFVDRIQSIFLKLKDSEEIDVPIEDPKHFNAITDELLKIYELPSKVFFGYMKSVVLYVFELCDIGKMPIEANIKNPKPISSTPLFDGLGD